MVQVSIGWGQTMPKYDIFSHHAVPFEVSAWCRQNLLTVYAQRLRKVLAQADTVQQQLNAARDRVDELEKELARQDESVRVAANFVRHVMADKGQTK